MHPVRPFLQVAAQVDSEHLRLGLEGEAFVVVYGRSIYQRRRILSTCATTE